MKTSPSVQEPAVDQRDGFRQIAFGKRKHAVLAVRGAGGISVIEAVGVGQQQRERQQGARRANPGKETVFMKILHQLTLLSLCAVLPAGDGLSGPRGGGAAPGAGLAAQRTTARIKSDSTGTSILGSLPGTSARMTSTGTAGATRLHCCGTRGNSSAGGGAGRNRVHHDGRIRPSRSKFPGAGGTFGTWDS